MNSVQDQVSGLTSRRSTKIVTYMPVVHDQLKEWIMTHIQVYTWVIRVRIYAPVARQVANQVGVQVQDQLEEEDQ